MASLSPIVQNRAATRKKKRKIVSLVNMYFWNIVTANFDDVEVFQAFCQNKDGLMLRPVSFTILLIWTLPSFSLANTSFLGSAHSPSPPPTSPGPSGRGGGAARAAAGGQGAI